jgi:molybdopterin-binding protein
LCGAWRRAQIFKPLLFLTPHQRFGRSLARCGLPCFNPRTFKEKTMSIQAINVRNQFKGKIKEIIRGDVVSEIDVQTPWGIVTSVITTRSVDDLNLQIGSDVVALVKSTEVSIAKL